MRAVTVAILCLVLSIASGARAETSEGAPARRDRWGVVALELTGGTTTVANSSFTESGSSLHSPQGNFSAKGRDLGYAHPFTTGFSVLVLRFITPAIAIGFNGGLSFGLTTPSPNAATAWVEPGGLSLIHVGFVAEGVLLEGPTSLRLGLLAGGRIVSIAAHAPQFQHDDEAALDAVFTPRLSLVHDWGTWGTFGAYVGTEFVSADMGSPSVVGGLFIGVD